MSQNQDALLPAHSHPLLLFQMRLTVYYKEVVNYLGTNNSDLKPDKQQQENNLRNKLDLKANTICLSYLKPRGSLARYDLGELAHRQE